MKMFRFKLNGLIKAVCFIPIAIALLGISAGQSEGKAKNLSEQGAAGDGA